MAFELEFRARRPPAVSPLIRRCHLHHRCFAAWEFERSHVAPPERRPSI
jgi:hypothetical protein